MIGDTYKIDIEPAIQLGIPVIQIGKNENPNIPCINSIMELKQML